MPTLVRYDVAPGVSYASRAGTMSGPTAGVLLPYLPDRAKSAAILAVSSTLDPESRSPAEFTIRSMAPIGGSPFSEEPGGTFGIFLVEPELEVAESVAVSQFCGFVPACEIQLVAYANGRADHRRLGELALFMARELAGVIDFGGELRADVVPIEGLAGRHVAIPYTTWGETEAVYHIGDVAFLEAWLSSPEFHMIK